MAQDFLAEQQLAVEWNKCRQGKYLSLLRIVLKSLSWLHIALSLKNSNVEHTLSALARHMRVTP